MGKRRRRNKPEGREPWAVGTTHRVEVEGLDGHPAALATVCGQRRARVPGGVPGDVVQAEVVAIGRKEVWTRILEIERPSPHRVASPCPHVERCGVCPWLSVRYREQLRAKGQVLRDAVSAREGLAGASVHDPVGVSPPVGYRTKIQMPFGGEPGALELGFWAPRSHDFVSIPSCVVQHPVAEAVRARIVDVLNRHPLAPYDEVAGTGDVRTLLVRVAEGSGDVGAVLVVRQLESFEWALLAAELTAIAELTGVWVNENPSRSNAVLGPRTVHLSGRRRLRDRLAGFPFERNPMSFFQTNHRATERLLAIVRLMVPDPVDALLDLYAGGGLFSVVLADRARVLHLVESHADAVAAAKATLNDAGVSGARIHLGRAEDLLPTLSEAGVSPDVAIVDPPRAGLDPAAARALVGMAPARIIYVSCHLRTLLRDLERLAQAGYRLREVRAVDMFPHTPHVETVSLLTLEPTGTEGRDA